MVSKLIGPSAGLLLILLLVFSLAAVTGASMHEDTSNVTLANTTAELDSMNEQVDANLSDSGVEGYYQDYMALPLVTQAENVAIAGVKYGHDNPRQGKIIGYAGPALVYGTMGYYIYRRYQHFRRQQ